MSEREIDGLLIAQELINAIHERSNQGWELALRRIEYEDGKYATFAEDYVPYFKEIAALCVNARSILRRESELTSFDPTQEA